ncbi:MAG: hypothetical protein K0S33_1658 [Bacteroidetes bacterium]|jgi:hypothetical protein|nr:hypothetical protein [Bacteroidota bacterium]
MVHYEKRIPIGMDPCLIYCILVLDDELWAGSSG